jgi:hypothetical protein
MKMTRYAIFIGNQIVDIIILLLKDNIFNHLYIHTCKKVTSIYKKLIIKTLLNNVNINRYMITKNTEMFIKI